MPGKLQDICLLLRYVFPVVNSEYFCCTSASFNHVMGSINLKSSILSFKNIIPHFLLQTVMFGSVLFHVFHQQKQK